MQRYKKEPYTLLYICTINLKKVKNEQIRPIIVVYSFLCYTFATVLTIGMEKARVLTIWPEFFYFAIFKNALDKS